MQERKNVYQTKNLHNWCEYAIESDFYGIRSNLSLVSYLPSFSEVRTGTERQRPQACWHREEANPSGH